MSLKIYKESVKQVIGIAAGKGGVGKSTVTVQLAHTLKALGYRVGVLDADLYGPSIRKMMPEESLPHQKGSLLYPAISFGMPVMSMAYFRRHDEAAAVRAPIAISMVRQFLDNIEWGELDYLLIDFPPGTGDIPLTLGQHAKLSGVLMVTTPQEVAVIDVEKAIDLFKQMRIPILGVVENMSYYHDPATKEKIYLFGQGGGKRLAERASIPYLGEIPLDPSLCQRTEEGKFLKNEAFIHLASYFALPVNP